MPHSIPMSLAITLTMHQYHPDRWVVISLTHDNETHKRVFATWFGGYAKGDSWKLNSGIVKTTFSNEIYSFEGESGSVYHCSKNTYGSTTYGWSVLKKLMDNSIEEGISIRVLDIAEIYNGQ
jgi:hypothetical protein